MVDIKKSIKDLGIQVLRDLLGSAPAAAAGTAAAKKEVTTIDDISLDDLRKEKIRYEMEQKRIFEQVEGVEKQKNDLFLRGTQTKSTRERRMLANQVKEKDEEAAHLDNMLEFISKRKRIINGLIRVKSQSNGETDILKNMDLKKLVDSIAEKTVDGEMDDERFKELWSVLNPGLVNHEDDQDIQDLMKAMEKAGEEGEKPEEHLAETIKGIHERKQDSSEESASEDL